MDATFDDAIFALQVTLAIKKLGIGLMGWFDGGAFWLDWRMDGF